MKRFNHPMYALLLLIPAMMMSLLTMFSSSAHASYTCTAHCYAEFMEFSSNAVGGSGITHYSFGNFQGMYTYDDVVSITESETTGRYNNEVWLVDDNVATSMNSGSSHFCFSSYDAVNHVYSNLSSQCWVETGYQKVGTAFTYDKNAGSEAWFISYILPWDGYVSGSHNPYCDDHSPFTGSCGYGELYGTQLASTDYGNFGDLEILFDSSTAHQIDTIADANGGSGTYTDGAIPNAYLNPTVTQTGTELVGTTGTSAPKTHFKHNQYETSGSWYYQSLDGSTLLIAGGSNLNGGWQTGGSYKPSTQSPNTGGIFDTCDQSGCAP